MGIEAVNPDQEEFFVGAAVPTTVVDELAPDLNATIVDYLATSQTSAERKLEMKQTIKTSITHHLQLTSQPEGTHKAQSKFLFTLVMLRFKIPDSLIGLLTVAPPNT